MAAEQAVPAPVVTASARRLDLPRCGLGESPRWGHGRWWWVDAERGTVWSGPPEIMSGDARAVPFYEAGGRVSLVQPVPGGVLVAAGPRILELSLGTDARAGAPRLWAEVPLAPDELLNDGTVDAAGRLWVGSVHASRSAGTGRLIVVDRTGSVRTVDRRTSLANGMAWLSAGRLLQADTTAGCLWEHEVDPSKTTVLGSRRRPLPPARPEAGPVLPDGIALDAAGGLWVALYGTGEVQHLVEDGTGWRVDAVIHVPTSQTTSVAVGGPDGRDLLLTTAQEGMSAPERAGDPRAGAVYAARAPSGPGGPPSRS